MGNNSGKATEKQVPDVHPFAERYGQLYGKLCCDGDAPDQQQQQQQQPEQDNGKLLNAKLFEQHFKSPDIQVTQNLFKNYFVDLVNPVFETKNMFVERCVHISSVVGGVPNLQHVQFLFNIVADNAPQLTETDLKKIVHSLNIFAIHQVVLDSEGCISETCHPFNEKDTTLTSISASILDQRTTVSCEEAAEWVHCNCPKMMHGVQTWLESKLTGHPKTLTGFIPQPSESLEDRRLLTPSCLWYLCCMLPSCYTYMENKYKTADEHDSGGGGESSEDTVFTWNLLFDSNQHGLSLNRFKHKVMEYKSPTVTLIEFSSGLTVALALDEKWKDSPEKYGGPYCQLLELSPRATVVETGSKMVYLKEMGRAVPTGLLIGAETKPAMRLSKDLCSGEIGYHGEEEAVVERMEVWGCGGVAALKAQKDVKRWEQKEVEKRKKVKLPGQWDTDKSILEMGGVTVNHSQRGDV